MRTMHPVLMTGVNEWDEDWLPRDEYAERLRVLRAAMSEHGWRGLVVHGDCDRSPLLAYLTNLNPIVRWAIALVGPHGDPELLVAGGTRDLPAALDQTWLRQIASYGDAGEILPRWIAALGERPRIAAYGFGTMRPPVHANIAGILAPLVEVEQADGVLDSLLFRTKRPREIAMIRQSADIVARSFDVLTEKYRGGATTTEAALAMERAARLSGVHDARIMLSFDGGRTLQPFVKMRPERGDPVVAYLAVRHTGYWAEAMTTLAASPTAAMRTVESALDDAIHQLKPGMSGREIAGAITARSHPLLKDQLGYGVGLALEEASVVPGDDTPVIAASGVYSLRAGIDDPQRGAAIASALVLVAKGAAQVLCRPRMLAVG
jgi:Xaa-Pro aminopeptidase